MNEPTYGLIGRGRVATHMARYLELEAQPFVTWHREMLSRNQPRTLGVAPNNDICPPQRHR